MQNKLDNKTDNATLMKQIELVDIEDVVPIGGNSLFLSLARVLIYMSFENPNFEKALDEFCGICKNDLKSDLDLQFKLRKKLCDYIYQNAFVLNKETGKNQLRKNFQKCFNGNIYDFTLQLYQLSINNFCDNVLFRRFAVLSFSKMLNINVCYRKSNGDWKLYEPDLLSIDKSKLAQDKLNLLNYLHESTIYLQEFSFNSIKINVNNINNNSNSNKNVRLLLNKKLWLSKYYDNYKVCMKFTQFNDADELKVYQEPKACLSLGQLIKFYCQNNDKINEDDYVSKIFCVFLVTLPIQTLIHCERINYNNNNSNNNLNNANKISSQTDNNQIDDLKEMEFSSNFNTIGKQFLKFEQSDHDKLTRYLNYLLNNKLDWRNESILIKYKSLMMLN